MDSEEETSSDSAQDTVSMDCHLSFLLNDDSLFPFPSCQPNICPVDYNSTLQMLENKLAENNRDRFIDLS